MSWILAEPSIDGDALHQRKLGQLLTAQAQADASSDEFLEDAEASKDEMRKRLLAAQPLDDAELIALAHARGQAVMETLVQAGVAADRISVRRGEIAHEGTRARLILDAR
ncbi:MAG: hypothetical protein LBV36_08495 [Chromatiales bacterium]|nr:hypothetical protein [Chromatiales bacterium]